MVMPGPFGGHCQNVKTLVRGADRHGGFGLVRSEVVERVQAADLSQGPDHVLGNCTLVERIGAAPGYRPQRLSKFTLRNDVARERRPAVGQKIALGVGAFLQLLKAVLPVERDTGRDHIPLLRGLDRGLQQGIEPELAVIVQNGRPCIDGAGYGDGVRRGQRDRVHVALEIPFHLRRLGRAA